MRTFYESRMNDSMGQLTAAITVLSQSQQAQLQAPQLAAQQHLQAQMTAARRAIVASLSTCSVPQQNVDPSAVIERGD